MFTKKLKIHNGIESFLVNFRAEKGIIRLTTEF